MSDELKATLESVCTSLAVNEGNHDDVLEAIAQIDQAYKDAGYRTPQEFYDRLMEEAPWHMRKMIDFERAARKAAGLETPHD